MNNPLRDSHIVLGVTGSIACYKAADLASKLTQEGAHVDVILTQGAANPMPILRKSIRVQGIYVGSRAMFLDMNAAIEAGGLKPVIDRRFAFADAPDAYRCMEAAGHFGKIVIEF